MESAADADTGPGEPTQMGPCEEGVWKSDHKDTSDDFPDGFGVTWCELTGSHVWCWNFVLISICQQHCHYDGCGIVVKF